VRHWSAEWRGEGVEGETKAGGAFEDRGQSKRRGFSSVNFQISKKIEDMAKMESKEA
jgi:hypothetical protein